MNNLQTLIWNGHVYVIVLDLSFLGEKEEGEEDYLLLFGDLLANLAGLFPEGVHGDCDGDGEREPTEERRHLGRIFG